MWQFKKKVLIQDSFPPEQKGAQESGSMPKPIYGHLKLSLFQGHNLEWNREVESHFVKCIRETTGNNNNKTLSISFKLAIDLPVILEQSLEKLPKNTGLDLPSSIPACI